MERYWANDENLEKLTKCQSYIRTWLLRKEFNELREIRQSDDYLSFITCIQANIRGRHSRKLLANRKQQWQSNLQFLTQVQALARGHLARSKYQRTLNHYRSNINKVIRVQMYVKSKLAENEYRKLTTDTNPSIKTVKSFIHLLNDNDLDFDRELAIEDLRQQVIENIRENNQLDAHVNALDIQIALFLKNAVTFDEVLKHSGAFKKRKDRQRKLTEMANKNHPLSFLGVDKESRQRLELFQDLVYLLQTEPKYLARLLSMTNRQDLGDFSSHKLIESSVLSLFGYATNAREEYLLINLCKVKKKKVNGGEL